MNFYHVELQGIIYTIPQTYKDVSFGEFVKFRNTLLDKPYELLTWAIGARIELHDTDLTERQVSGILSLADRLVDQIFKYTSSGEKDKLPDSITVMSTEVPIKRGFIQELPYWPYVRCKTIVDTEFKNALKAQQKFDPTERYNEILAHYLYTVVTGLPYVEARAEEFTVMIDEMPFTDVIQLGNFFVKRLKRSQK